MKLASYTQYYLLILHWVFSYLSEVSENKLIVLTPSILPVDTRLGKAEDPRGQVKELLVGREESRRGIGTYRAGRRTWGSSSGGGGRISSAC